MADENKEKQGLKLGGQIQGISLESFLQMVQIDKKTCTLKVSTARELGFMHIHEGELVASETGDLAGEKAAMKIISWESSDLVINKYSGGNKRTITKPLMTLLMNGLKSKDEKRESEDEKNQDHSNHIKGQSKLDNAEKLVNQYVTEGKTEAATKLLFDLIVKNAKNKNFIKAEELRDRLQEVDSLALNEIISSAEIIEEEKMKSVDKNHMKIWSKIYNILSTEEASDLYYSLKKVEIGAYDQALYQAYT